MNDVAQGKRMASEIPWDKIREIITNTGPESLVMLRVQRRQPNGELRTEVGKRPMKAQQLLDIEEWLEARGGGGRYEIWVRDTSESPMLLTSFPVNLNSAVRVWDDPEERMRRAEIERQEALERAEALRSNAAKYPLPARFAGLHPEQIPKHPRAEGWIASLPTVEQWRLLPDITDIPLPAVAGGAPGAPMLSHSVQLPPGASMATDALALHQAQNERAEKQNLAAENARLNERLAAEKALHQQELTGLREKIAEVERKSTAKVHETEVQTLERKMEAQIGAMEARLAAAMRVPEPPKSFLQTLDPATITALAPLLIPVVQSLVARPDPMAQLVPLLAATRPASSGLDDIVKLAPIVTPLITAFMAQRGPEAQAKLYETLMDGNQQNIALAAQIIQLMTQQAGGENPAPWVPLVQGLISGGTEMVATWLEERKKAAIQAQQGPRMVHGGQTTQLPPRAQTPPQQVQQQPPAQAQPAQGEPAPAAASPSNGAGTNGAGGPVAAGYATVETPAEVVPTSDASHAVDATPDGTPSAEEVVEMFTSHPQVPPQFKTTPWRSLVYRMHSGDPDDAPEMVAEALIGQLEREERRGPLPALIAQWRTMPLVTFTNLSRFLPVNDFNSEYAELLVQSCVAIVENGDGEAPTEEPHTADGP